MMLLLERECLPEQGPKWWWSEMVEDYFCGSGLGTKPRQGRPSEFITWMLGRICDLKPSNLQE